MRHACGHLNPTRAVLCKNNICLLLSNLVDSSYEGLHMVCSASVLNSHFQSALNVSGSMGSGLSAVYFGAYFICSPTISG